MSFVIMTKRDSVPITLDIIRKMVTRKLVLLYPIYPLRVLVLCGLDMSGFEAKSRSIWISKASDVRNAYESAAVGLMRNYMDCVTRDLYETKTKWVMFIG